MLIYFGDLRPVFSAAATALRRGGILAVSTERAGGTDYQLGPSGRFAHSPKFVVRAASEWFETLVVRDTTLRREGVDRVHGSVFVFRAKVSDYVTDE